ncbi:MAG: DUF6713 family protein [Bacteroidota bacterium]
MEIDYFLLALAFILMHEIDAIRCREWRIFPGLFLLPDRTGMIVFQALHIPDYTPLFAHCFFVALQERV